MRRCDFTPEAVRDLREIHAYIGRESARRARRLIEGLEAECLRLAQVPGMGRMRVEFHQDLRSFPVSPYLIFYRELPDGVEIVRVLHGARDLSALFSDAEPGTN